mmetsp:Transcript_25077/g.54571  ORF Transcript_25077/g.54571 Transcript_25077/m.54571 type:complete len:248 (+) Transcript_25077:318-1061(+)
MLGGLVDPHTANEESDEGHDANALENAIDQESPTVDAKSCALLIRCKVADENSVQGREDDEDSHEDVDHEQLHPEEEEAPAVYHLRPSALNLGEDAREVVVHVHNLAKAEGMPLRLYPPRLDSSEPAFGLRRVVQDREEDGRDSQAASGGEEAFQRHVPILGDPVRIPALDGLGQAGGDGVGRVGNPHGVGVGEVRQLVLRGHKGGDPDHGGLLDVVFQVEDGWLPDREVPVWGDARLASGVDEIVS